jgi:hypothetical protein
VGSLGMSQGRLRLLRLHDGHVTENARTLKFIDAGFEDG